MSPAFLYEAALSPSPGRAVAGLAVGDLVKLPGSDPRKVALAGLLWLRTTVSHGWSLGVSG